MILATLLATFCILLVVGAAVCARRRSITRGTQVTHAAGMAILTGVTQATLSVPAGWVAERMHRWLHPSDDWFDVAGAGALLLTLASAPVVALFAGLGMLAWAQARRGPESTICPTCGYDLRASAGHGCPECGADRAAERTP